MRVTVPIENYELTLPVGEASPTNRIKIFTKSNTHRIRQVAAEFDDRHNRNPLKQLLEGASTGVRVIRLRLGEDEIASFLDFLRNEKNRHVSIDFDPESRGAFLGEIEGVSQQIRIFESRGEVTLESKVTQRPRSPLSQIFRPIARR